LMRLFFGQNRRPNLLKDMFLVNCTLSFPTKFHCLRCFRASHDQRLARNVIRIIKKRPKFGAAENWKHNSGLKWRTDTVFLNSHVQNWLKSIAVFFYLHTKQLNTFLHTFLFKAWTCSWSRSVILQKVL
jgi:hypothetical protein